MNSIYHDIEISSNPKSIFQMLSTSEGLNVWWTFKSRVELKVGGEIRLFFSKDFDWTAKIFHLQDNKFISYKFVTADIDWVKTELSFEIIPKSENISVLRFEHKNWLQINDHYRRTSYCWALYFKKMKDFLEQK